MIITPTEDGTQSESSDAAELLIKEARGKARRRRSIISLVIAAVLVAAVLVVVFSGQNGRGLSATEKPGSKANASLATCLPVNIKARNGPRVSAATGEHARIITLTNRGTSPCVLDGYLRLRLVTATGTVLDLPQVTHNQYVTNARPRPVSLRVGAVTYVEVAKYRCDLGDLQMANRVQFTLPGSKEKTVFTVPLGSVPGLSRCKGGATDPGNSIAVTPFEASLRALSP